MKLTPRWESPTEWCWGRRPRGSGKRFRESSEVQSRRDSDKDGITAEWSSKKLGGIMGAQLWGRAGPDCKNS